MVISMKNFWGFSQGVSEILKGVNLYPWHPLAPALSVIDNFLVGCCWHQRRKWLVLKTVIFCSYRATAYTLSMNQFTESVTHWILPGHIIAINQWTSQNNTNAKQVPLFLGRERDENPIINPVLILCRNNNSTTYSHYCLTSGELKLYCVQLYHLPSHYTTTVVHLATPTSIPLRYYISPPSYTNFHPTTLLQ